MQEIINQLVQLAKNYDPFTAYIDDYKQYEQAKKKNEALRKEWNDICQKHELVINGVSCYANLGDRTEAEITESLRR